MSRCSAVIINFPKDLLSLILSHYYTYVYAYVFLNDCLVKNILYCILGGKYKKIFDKLKSLKEMKLKIQNTFE